MGKRMKGDPAGFIGAAVASILLIVAGWYSTPRSTSRAELRSVETKAGSDLSEGPAELRRWSEGKGQVGDGVAGRRASDDAQPSDEDDRDGQRGVMETNFEEENRRRFRWMPDAIEDHGMPPSQWEERVREMLERTRQ